MWAVWNLLLMQGQSSPRASQEQNFTHLNLYTPLTIFLKISPEVARNRAFLKANLPPRDKKGQQAVANKVNTALLTFKSNTIPALKEIGTEVTTVNADGSHQEVFDSIFECLFALQPRPPPPEFPKKGRVKFVVSIMGPPGVGKSTITQLIGQSRLRCQTLMFPQLEDMSLTSPSAANAEELKHIAQSIVSSVCGDVDEHDSDEEEARKKEAEVDLVVVDGLARSKNEWLALQAAIRDHREQQPEDEHDKVHIVWFGVLLTCAKDECESRLLNTIRSSENARHKLSAYEKAAFDFHFNFDKGRMDVFTKTISAKNEPLEVVEDVLGEITRFARSFPTFQIGQF